MPSFSVKIGLMRLSILIISYNTKILTCRAIDSIQKSLKNCDFSYEILILDNNSTDGSAKAIKALKIKNLHLFESKQNLGFGKGNNFLAKKAKADYLLLLNSDIEILNNGILKLLNFFANQNRFQFVGAKLLNQDLSEQPSCGPLYNPLVALLALFFLGDRLKITRYSPKQVRQVGWVSGACILTTKKNYILLNGFDENIFMYMEEIDLFKRAQEANLKVGFYPEAKLIHYGFASSGSKSQPVINVFKGYLYYYQKHYSSLGNLYIRLLLKTKALVGYTVGILLNNQYLKKTYVSAYKIVN